MEKDSEIAASAVGVKESGGVIDALENECLVWNVDEDESKEEEEDDDDDGDTYKVEDVVEVDDFEIVLECACL